jgi:hypothetical protein
LIYLKISQLTKAQYNRLQNHPDFELESIENLVPLFKNQLLKKTLNPIQEDLNNPRTYTIKNLIKDYK